MIEAQATINSVKCSEAREFIKALKSPVDSETLTDTLLAANYRRINDGLCYLRL